MQCGVSGVSGGEFQLSPGTSWRRWGWPAKGGRIPPFPLSDDGRRRGRLKRILSASWLWSGAYGCDHDPVFAVGKLTPETQGVRYSAHSFLCAFLRGREGVDGGCGFVSKNRHADGSTPHFHHCDL